ncbi:protein Dr1 homolog [Oryza brachyantha]|uniref:Transcription factor CBF/NF-Y/archaeal histone domain-containing protein n=1 Tax=Oryza brachyantha TaxID=4533 RepID=J3MSP4_ORYBR|nr:protein Dr1 homolog [Oryza brachyantha]
MDPMDIVGKSKEDVSLPKSTMFKIIKEMLPPDVRVARDAQDLLVECCVEFINLLSSESNEVCSREDKKTIAPEHVLRALQDLGFREYIEEVQMAYEQHKHDTLDSPKASKFTGVEMTEEQAVAEQQRMFAEARARMNNGAAKPKDPEPEAQQQTQPPSQPQVHPQPQQPLQPQLQPHSQPQQQPSQILLHPQSQHIPQLQPELRPQQQQSSQLQPQPQLHPQLQPAPQLQTQPQLHPQPPQPPQMQPQQPQLHQQPQQPQPSPQAELQSQSQPQTEEGLDSL